MLVLSLLICLENDDCPRSVVICSLLNVVLADGQLGLVLSHRRPQLIKLSYHLASILTNSPSLISLIDGYRRIMKFTPVIVTLALGRRPDYAYAQETKAAKNDAKAAKTKPPAAAKAAKNAENLKIADTAAPTSMSLTAAPTSSPCRRRSPHGPRFIPRHPPQLHLPSLSSSPSAPPSSSPTPFAFKQFGEDIDG